MQHKTVLNEVLLLTEEEILRAILEFAGRKRPDLVNPILATIETNLRGAVAKKGIASRLALTQFVSLDLIADRDGECELRGATIAFPQVTTTEDIGESK